MEIKMPDGCVLATTNPDVIESYLKMGGKEVTNKKATKKSATKEASASDAE